MSDRRISLADVNREKQKEKGVQDIPLFPDTPQDSLFDSLPGQQTAGEPAGLEPIYFSVGECVLVKRGYCVGS